jgi:hypothetical protein
MAQTAPMHTEWEEVSATEVEGVSSDTTSRLAVDGGYLYRNFVWNTTHSVMAVAMTFVPTVAPTEPPVTRRS